MRQVNIHEAKTRLSELVAAVEAGEEIVIARAGKPIARLVQEPEERQVYRQGGGWAGRIQWNQNDWDAADQEIEALFEESINRPIE